MKFKLSSATIALLIFSAPIAYSDPISVSGFLPAALVYTPEPGNILSVTSSGFFGLATYKLDTGSAIFGAMSFVTQPLFSGEFQITPSAPETFTFSSSTNSDFLSILINWNKLVDGGEAELVGTGIVTDVGALSTLEFQTDFHVGDTITADGFFPTECALAGMDSCNILSGVQVGFFEGANINDGRTPTQHDVPEPSSLGILGAGLIILWGLITSTRKWKSIVT